MLDVIALPNVGESYESNTPKNVLGLVHYFQKYPNKKWYLSGGCDMFVRGDMLKSTLGRFNSSLPVWTGRLGKYEQMIYVSGGVQNVVFLL